MGVLMAADDCCTTCCLGGAIVITAVVGAGLIVATIPLEIACSPITVPLRIKRGNRIKKGIAQFLEPLTQEDKELFMAEFGKKVGDTLVHKDIRKYFNTLNDKLKNYKTRTTAIETKINILPSYYKSNIVWVGVPSVDKVSEELRLFFNALKVPETSECKTEETRMMLEKELLE